MREHGKDGLFEKEDKMSILRKQDNVQAKDSLKAGKGKIKKMKIDKELEKKIGQLQLMEQNIQNIVLQKQMFQTQLFEIENALKELGKSKGQIYKIIGPIMVASKKDDLKKDLDSKKEVMELRIKNLEKQEESIKTKASEMQSEVMGKLKNVQEGS